MSSTILCFLRLRKKPDSRSGSPPSYTTIPKHSQIQIKATDTPQWIWSNAQCREWLKAVMINNFGSSADEAAEVAKGWKGFGPNIYIMNNEDWRKLVGEQQGQGLYCILVAVRDEKDACPTNIKLGHGGGRHGVEPNNEIPI